MCDAAWRLLLKLCSCVQDFLSSCQGIEYRSLRCRSLIMWARKKRWYQSQTSLNVLWKASSLYPHVFITKPPLLGTSNLVRHCSLNTQTQSGYHKTKRQRQYMKTPACSPTKIQDTIKPPVLSTGLHEQLGHPSAAQHGASPACTWQRRVPGLSCSSPSGCQRNSQ